MDWLNKVKYDENGLVPAIAQDEKTGRVLMMAWMNAESLALTVQKKQAVYWSRSRNRLWHKGETSSNYQKVSEICLDCDADVILLKVEQLGGVACHTGRQSCFYRTLEETQEGHEWKIQDPVLVDPKKLYS